MSNTIQHTPATSAAEIASLSASEMAARLVRGEVSSVALVEACLARIEARDGALRAWAHVDPDLALTQARARDDEPRRSVLHGVPIGIKDIFDTFDMPTRHGSSAFKAHRPTADSAIVGLLRRAGLVILGKCATTEFASPVPIGVRNPHHAERSPGVSSSGSAAAVADFMVPLATGSQTGGSTILPAAFCGIVGFKASLSGLDRGGTRHLRPTLDTVGLFARDLADIAQLNCILTGRPIPATPAGVAGLRVGVCKTINWSEAEPAAVDAIQNAVRALRDAGAIIVEAEMPAVFEGIDKSFQTIAVVEGARTVAADFEAHGATMNWYMQEMAQRASGFDNRQYEAAQAQAFACQQALAHIFESCDVILTPSTCGEATSDLTGVPNSAFNRIWTLMHGPCVNIPAYKGPDGLPVGVQLVGRVGSDPDLIACAQRIAPVLTGM